MARRKRNEPLWPLVLILGVVGGGLALGAALTGDAEPGAASSIVDPPPSDLDTSAVPAAWDRIRVEVLNAGGIDGAAAAARDRLRDQGFDVVYFGNAESWGREESLVLNRGSGAEVADAVARAVGIGTVEAEEDSTRLVDVTVLLGTDWDPATATAGEGAAPAESDRAWWDPRRLFTGTR